MSLFRTDSMTILMLKMKFLAGFSTHAMFLVLSGHKISRDGTRLIRKLPDPNRSSWAAV